MAWIGVIGTFTFGAVSLFQLIREIIKKKVRASEEKHVEALGNTLADLRHMCNDTVERNEVLKTNASKQFVRQIAMNLRSAEGHVQVIQNSLKAEHGILEWLRKKGSN